MRIALTGASSTGKTTLAQRVVQRRPELHRLNADARNVLTRLGHSNTAGMTAAQFSEFQLAYVLEKEALEDGDDDYITDRSFVDSWVYWVRHCATVAGLKETQRMESICRARAAMYDIHIFLPFGLVPFENDGFRHPSIAYHVETGAEMASTLKLWGLRHLICELRTIDDRVQFVEDAIKSI